MNNHRFHNPDYPGIAAAAKRLAELERQGRDEDDAMRASHGSDGHAEACKCQHCA